MVQIALRLPFGWFIQIGQNTMRSTRSPRRAVQDLREFSPHLKRDLGLRDVDSREHRLR